MFRKSSNLGCQCLGRVFNVCHKHPRGGIFQTITPPGLPYHQSILTIPDHPPELVLVRWWWARYGSRGWRCHERTGEAKFGKLPFPFSERGVVFGEGEWVEFVFFFGGGHPKVDMLRGKIMWFLFRPTFGMDWLANTKWYPEAIQKICSFLVKDCNIWQNSKHLN